MRALFHTAPGEQKYIHACQSNLPGISLLHYGDKFESVFELVRAAQLAKAEAIITTDPAVLSDLLPDCKNATISAQQGALFKKYGMEILILPSPNQLYTVDHCSFLYNRFATKLTHPEKWAKPTKFTFSLLKTVDELKLGLTNLRAAKYLVIDIETKADPDNLIIDEYGVTGIFYDPETSQHETMTYVVPMNSMDAVEFMRLVNAMPQPKIGQNFQFDISYMHHWNAPVNNWRFDTATLMHCWYSELPKDLGFMGCFTIRDTYNWKYMNDVNDYMTKVAYNAMDTWGTANAFLSFMNELPDWAVKNFMIEFPLNFPAVLMNAQGIRVDQEMQDKIREEREVKIAAALASIKTMTNSDNFNPNSSKQCVKLLQILGFHFQQTANDDDFEKIKASNFFAGRILSKIQDYRGLVKEVSNYLQKSSLFNGRMLFAFSPHGTVTGRPSCKAHHFSFQKLTSTGNVSKEYAHVGINLQTIPRGDDDDNRGLEYSVKHQFVSDEGWELAEADKEQAESRHVAYLSGDEGMLDAVDGGKDFHSTNCSRFFGVPYNEIYDDAAGKALNKPLRNLSKRVNHGATYNMAEFILVQTMTIPKVLDAGRLLKLPYTAPLAIGKYLLNCFDTAYPAIRKDWYNDIKLKIKFTKRLTNPYGWTRYCFGDPSSSKQAMNAYAATLPQGGNAMDLNQAILRIFKLALEYPDNIRLSIAIHDSILFQIKKSPDSAKFKQMVLDNMDSPVDVTDIKGITRRLCVPSACSDLCENWGEAKG